MTQKTNSFSVRTARRLGFLALTCISASWGTSQTQADPLEAYVRAPDQNYNWKQTEAKAGKGFTVFHLELVSQHWRGQFWSHHLRIVRPFGVRNPEIAFLFITGDGDGEKQLSLVQTLAERAGALAAVITKVPNQPLYGGRKEDALIAYTFDRYTKTGDETWPLLFPMVKSAVRAMDAIQAFARQELGQSVKTFVVGGASKRGWTTWLTAAVDPRVQAIAPMVIDMLNMKPQTQWAEEMYGKQSEQIQDYTDLQLIERMDEPAMVRLRQWVDPYSYRHRYTMPKLLLLGTNDPYWVVDSLRHYWDALPEPKLIFQTPNAGHDLGGGKEATQTLAAFFQLIADGHPLPRMEWTLSSQAPSTAKLAIRLDQPVKELLLWTAQSADRDFRDEKWTSRSLAITAGSNHASAEIQMPERGFRAYMGEAVLKTSTGHEFRLSTEARVTPDLVNKHP